MSFAINALRADIAPMSKKHDLTTIGGRITFARRSMEPRPTQQEFAELCGWEHQSRVSAYERNKREPSSDDIAVMAREAGVTRSWLATGEGHMRNPLLELVKQQDASAVKASAQYTVPPGEMTEAVETFLRLPRAAQHRVFALILEEADKAGIAAAPERSAGSKITIVAGGPDEPEPGETEPFRDAGMDASDKQPQGSKTKGVEAGQCEPVSPEKTT